MESRVTKAFSEAVRHMLHKHGDQATLAKKVCISTGYLNDLLSERKRYWPGAIKERVACKKICPR